MVVGIGGAVYYLVDDYKKRDCDSFIGRWESRCIVNTTKNTITGAWDGIKSLF
jgi:hypothetical protein